MSRNRRHWSGFGALAIVAGAVMLHPAAQAADSYVPGPEYTPGPRTVIVKDTGGEFEPQTTRMLVNEKITFVLADEAQQKHSVDFCNPYVPCEDRWELDPADPNARQFTRTFSVRADYGFRCTIHGTDGVVKVREPATTTTTAPSPSATTASTSPATPPPAESTTTTTTTPPPTTTAVTSAPATPGAAEPGTYSGASQSTPTTITSKPPAPLPPAATSPPPDVAAAQATATEDSKAEAAGADDESALDGPETQEDPAGGSGTNGKAMILIAVVLAIALASAGWGWFHRASRYHPA